MPAHRGSLLASEQKYNSLPGAGELVQCQIAERSPGELMQYQLAGSSPGKLVQYQLVGSSPGELVQHQLVGSSPGELVQSQLVGSSPGELVQSQLFGSSPGELVQYQLLHQLQLVGIAVPASWHCTSWPGALMASWRSTSLLGALLAIWCSTSSLGEPPGELALYQINGIGEPPTSCHCTSWPGETRQWYSIYITRGYLPQVPGYPSEMAATGAGVTYAWFL
ncbi:hypothetical protein PCANC_25940 [Puccinia coronata f. sp. avenae]|uniref:Uncharacterized protein n=1 Tax=Puccinia coronata f. sp. avenae TaxID=200324 RepID=A0A2N5U6H9_9BASI|nr:hypothetical protein PCANC_25940 [Puccinia coronata f. sp. avenae]